MKYYLTVNYSPVPMVMMFGLVFAVVMFGGCGKKAPPIAPNQTPLIGVNDLKGHLDQGHVRLTWHHKPENAKAVGYIVLRAQSALSKNDCPDCSQVYQKVGTVPVNRSLRRQRHVMEFYQKVADGFRYTFDVRPYQSSERQGPESNQFVISHPLDGEDISKPSEDNP